MRDEREREGERREKGDRGKERRGGRMNLRDTSCACAHMWTHLKDSTILFVFQLN